jgi:maltokinase
VTATSGGRSLALTDLADLVTATQPDALVPPGRAGSAGLIGPIRLLTSVALGPGQLAVVADAADRTLVVPLVITDGGVRRARVGDGMADALVAAVVEGGWTPSEMHVDVLHAAPAAGERSVGVDQTHESVIVGERAVVKWTVAAEPGEQPAPAKLKTLDAAGFAAMAHPWAFVTWRPPDRPPVLLASVSDYLPEATDGWTWCVEDVRAVAAGRAPLDDAVAPAREIGRLTAQMHVALAGPDAPVQADIAQARTWATTARNVLDEAVMLVDGDEGRRLRARAPRIGTDIDRLADVATTPVISVHGDFHVGQVLRCPVADGWRYAFVDFDGNPVLSAAQRLQPQPGARDVAGMLASLDHVGRVVVHRTDGVDLATVEEWMASAQSGFLASYHQELAVLGRTDLFDTRLLRGLRAEQECREFVYAVRHLPHWRYVPDAALAALYPDLDPDDEHPDDGR